jgi:hypothetical protein
MLFWTVVAVIMYAHESTRCIVMNTVDTYPDIDTALVVLSGLGQGVYLGQKLITTDTPRIVAVTPTEVKPGLQVELTGAAFGTGELGGNEVLFDGIPIPWDGKRDKWSPGAIKFTVPPTHPAGGDWPKDGVWVSVVANGHRSANEVNITVKA